ncbi:hypothetical protein CF326_g8944 [Tilletia indica]|nr:hypothetical protein CF326_g8944 [Tilletia indica]
MEPSVLLPAEAVTLGNLAMDAIGPFQQFLDDQERDVMMIPSHLVVLQDVIDALASFASALPASQYDPIMRRLIHIREQLDHLERTMPETRPEPRWQRSPRGQLKINIDSDVLCELVELEFTDNVISTILGTSISTIERRRRELGLRKRGGPTVSDEELHAAIKSTYALGFEAGERGMRGALRTVGVQVSRERLRQALQSVDPHRLQARWAKTIRRRDYYVPFVNSLWHIDGHHKLIRYKIVIHGGVDGKSRVVTFMQANSNNRADTVSACFLAAVQQWSWPSRVRADYGGENLGVKELMEQMRGLRRGSFIQGPSTRNQRIERMWVEVQRWTTGSYRAMFQALEDDGLLDVASPIHLRAQLES